jgi:hypothetical protein
MTTAACGINCNVCRLQVMGICSTCGSGLSPEADHKIQVQEHLFGQPCPILACAKANQIAYCMRDCHAFPCESFSRGPYPFSQGYLDMQRRRRDQYQNAAVIPSQGIIVPPEFWGNLSQKNLADICDIALARQENPESLTMDFLDTEIQVRPALRQCFLKENGVWQPVDHPLLELLALVYLLQVKPGWLANDVIAVQDLKDAQFFQGPHEFKTAMVLEQFGYDIEGFCIAAEKLSGVRVHMADIAYKLRPFPKIPLYFLLWKGDDEFKPRLTILFDRSIDQHLSADAIWGLVNLVCELLVQQARQDVNTCG